MSTRISTAGQPFQAAPQHAWFRRLMAWARGNLFPTPFDAALNLVIVALFAWLVASMLPWALLDATWSGGSRADCTGTGACWAFVLSRLDQFIYGFYPAAERWRVNLAAAVLILGLAALLLRAVPGKRVTGLLMLLAYPPLALWLLKGGVLGLAEVQTDRWGGLVLTLVVGVSGIVLSFPIGIALALGRRSELPVFHGLSVLFIELWRGLPMVTVLFMAIVMLPYFLPAGMKLDSLGLAIAGIVMFQSACLAEIVRGGLQAVPKGQYEAAKALGFGYWRANAYIVLPQAIRIVIPGLVNNSIALLKDTTLVMVVGLFDLLNIVAAGSSDPRWLGSATEGYIFVGLVFWTLCFAMSRYSHRLEHSLRSRRQRLGGVS